MTESLSISPAATLMPERNARLEANQQLGRALRGRCVHAVEDRMQESDDCFAYRDPLTGLPGRAALLERFNAATVKAQRDGKRLGVLFLDLDGFKWVNDGLSHRTGDAALRHVARCLNASVRCSDTVSRHGGDEFVILLNDLSMPAEAARVAENMLGRLMAPERIGEHAVSMSASIGICIYPDDGCDLEELIHQADGAMYRAKRQGPGYYVFHGAAEPAGPQRLAPEIAAGVIYPHTVFIDHERQRQAQMQEASQHLLLAALSAQALQMAAQRALGDQTALLARVAHELRNPLTPIRMAASLIDRAAVHELPRLREIIERQVAHASRLVGDLLDLSRAQVGKLRLQRSEVDVCCIASDVIRASEAAMQARRQRLLVEMPVRSLLVDGDSVRLTQVLANLLDNASKYTPEEGTITVALRGAGTDVVISVSDTGIGIRAEAIADVFRPFVQESHATSFNGCGLGIGLTVVRELVEAHGGKVQAFSAGEGLGSRFVLTLPRHAGAEERNEEAAPR